MYQTLHITEKKAWYHVEDAILENLEMYSMEQLCLIEHAGRLTRPRPIALRVSDMLYKKAKDLLATGAPTLKQLTYISQGFKHKQSFDLL